MYFFGDQNILYVHCVWFNVWRPNRLWLIRQFLGKETVITSRGILIFDQRADSLPSTVTVITRPSWGNSDQGRSFHEVTCMVCMCAYDGNSLHYRNRSCPELARRTRANQKRSTKSWMHGCGMELKDHENAKHPKNDRIHQRDQGYLTRTLWPWKLPFCGIVGWPRLKGNRN